MGTASGRRGKTVDRLAALARTEREGIRPAQQRGAYKGQKKALTPEQAAQLVQGAKSAESGYWPSGKDHSDDQEKSKTLRRVRSRFRPAALPPKVLATKRPTPNAIRSQGAVEASNPDTSVRV
jgi:hypothetical protein